MSRKTLVVLGMLMLASGVLGGVVSRWVAPVQPAAAQADVLTVRGINIVDDTGTTKLFLGTEQYNQAPLLFMYDRSGKVRLQVAMNNLFDSPVVALLGPGADAETDLVSLGYDSDGKPTLNLGRRSLVGEP